MCYYAILYYMQKQLEWNISINPIRTALIYYRCVHVLYSPKLDIEWYKYLFPRPVFESAIYVEIVCFF